MSSRAVRARWTAAALTAYVAISTLYFGWPVLAHPGRVYIGSGYDPQLFVWMFAWWPHALLHGENPLVTHAIWAPVGQDLSWVTSVPALALAFAPVTLAFGPVLGYNLAAVLLPALAAWTAFLLCRHVTGSPWASLLGGYLFGFSSYVIGQTQGHPHMTAVFLLPLVALLVLRGFEGSLAPRELVLRLGVTLGMQLLLSTELFFTLTLALIVGVAAAAATVPAVRGRLLTVARSLVGAYVLAAVLASPLLVDALVHFNSRSVNEPSLFSTDLLNILVPTRLAAFTTSWTETTAAHFVANTAEAGGYLGLPLAAVVLWYGWYRRRVPAARLLLLLLGLALLAELGPRLRIRGTDVSPLPWRALTGLPAFNNVLPARLAAYAALAASVVAALWAAGPRPRPAVRAALGSLAVLALVPAFWHADWHVHPTRVAFFTEDLYRRCLAPGANVVALPYPSWGDSMLWQAEHGLRFRLADGSVSPLIPPGVPDLPVVTQLLSNDPPTGGGRAILRFARDQHADAILVEGSRAEPWRQLLAPVATGREVGGVYLYPLGEGARPCE